MKTNGAGAAQRRGGSAPASGDIDQVSGFLGESRSPRRTGAAALSPSFENRNKMPGTFIREHVHPPPTRLFICLFI